MTSSKQSPKPEIVLPLCVRIDLEDLSSRKALIEDGWRDIGTLDTWIGQVGFHGPRSQIKVASSKEAVASYVIAQQIDWTGRLFRDKEFSNDDARKTMLGHMVQFDEIYVCRKNGKVKGFSIFQVEESFLRIVLIGLLEEARGQGFAKDMIYKAVQDYGNDVVIAGTYSDNISSEWLYSGLGMDRLHRERVFHK